MDLRQIEYIIAIEQEESISKAAEKLFITQSALNQQLLKLEKELGMPLFERKKRQMKKPIKSFMILRMKPWGRLHWPTPRSAVP